MADKFQIELPAAPEPASLAQATNLERTAAAETLQAGQAAGQALGGAIVAGGAYGLELYKGSLFAQERADIESLKAGIVPESAAEADKLITVRGNNPPGMFKTEADRIAAMHDQGVINSSERDLRLAAIVRHYSDKMPGWASDFRRHAAEITGVSSTGGATTGKLLSEEIYRKDVENQLQQDYGVMAYYGLPDRGTITPELRASYLQVQAAHAQTQEIDDLRKQQTWNDEQRLRINQGYVASLVNTDTLELGVDFNRFMLASGGKSLADKAVADELALSFTQRIENRKQALITNIRRLTQLDPTNPNFLTLPQADEQITRYSKVYDQFAQGLKEGETRNLFLKTIEDLGKAKEGQQAQIALVMPTTEYLKQTTLGAKMIEDIAANRFKPEYAETRWGKLGRMFVEEYTRAPEQITRIMGGVQTQAMSQKAAASVSPAAVSAEIENAKIRTRAFKRGDKVAEATVRDVQNINGDGTPDNPGVGPLSGDKGRAWVEEALLNPYLAHILAAGTAEQARQMAAPIYDKIRNEALKSTPAMIQQFVNDRVETTVHPDGTITVPANTDQSIKNQVRDFNNRVRMEHMVGPYAVPDFYDAKAAATTFHDQYIRAARQAMTEAENRASVIAPLSPGLTGGRFQTPPESQVKSPERLRAERYREYVNRLEANPPGGPTTHRGTENYQPRRRAATPGEAANATDVGRRTTPGAPAELGEPASTADLTVLHGDAIRTVESGNNPEAKNPNSTATGPDQIIAATWIRFKADAAKQLGIPVEQMDITNPEHSAVVRDLNISAGKAKLPALGVDPGSLDAADEYALHHFGITAGPKVVAARDSVKMGAILSDAALTANGISPSLTVGEWRAHWNRRFRELEAR